MNALKKHFIICSTSLYFGIATHAIAFDDSFAIYEGKIQDYPIVLQYSATEDGFSGTYFYKKQSRDIPLEGMVVEGFLHFEEGEANSGQGMNIYIFNEPIEGIWFNFHKDTELPLSLTAVDTIDLTNESSAVLKKIAANDVYEYLRHKSLPLKADKHAEFMGQPIQWHVEPKSKLKFFTLQSNSSQQLNETLEFNFRSYLSLAYSCSDVELAVTPSYLTDEITSFTITGNYYCPNMPHPNFIHESFNFHNKSGKRLKLSDVLSIPNPEYKNEWFVEQFSKLNLPQMQDVDCPYMAADSWNISEDDGWVLTEQGIRINPQFPHVLAACSGVEWAILPFDLVALYPSLINITHKP